MNRRHLFYILSGSFIGILGVASAWNHRLGLALLALVFLAVVLVGLSFTVLLFLSTMGLGRAVDVRSAVPEFAIVNPVSGPTVLIGQTILSDKMIDVVPILAAAQDVAAQFGELGGRGIRVEVMVPISLFERVAWKISPPERNEVGLTLIMGPPLFRIKKGSLMNARTRPLTLRWIMSHEITHLMQHQFRECHQPPLPWSIVHHLRSEKTTDLYTLARVGESVPYPPSYLKSPPRVRKSLQSWKPHSSIATTLAREAIRRYEQDGLQNPVEWWEATFEARVLANSRKGIQNRALLPSYH